MIEEIGAEGFQPTNYFAEESLFKLQCLIKATEIQHSAHCEYENRLFLAVTTANAEIFLYYKKDSVSVPIIKRIPWFQGSHKQISALCFHHMGTWLLSASIDGSVYISPALCFVDENYEKDKRWTSDDITSFPSISSQSSHSKPTAIIWWQSTLIPAEIGIVGTEYGEIIFINLETGHQTNVTQVKGNIETLHLCRDQSNDIVSLLITSQSRRQWRLLLEQRTYSCLNHLENGESYSVVHSSDNIYDNTKIFASTRSRLQGLKQLSMDKLAILRQKLIETKSQTLGENLQYDITSNRNTQNATVNSDPPVEEVNQNQITPEAMSKKVFLMSQLDRDGQQFYTCYHSISSQLFVYGPNFTTVPLSAHKVLESCRNVLLTQRFFFITDNSQAMYVISDRLSETRKADNNKFNPECIVGHFSLANSKEIIRAVYRAIDLPNNAPNTHSEDSRSKCPLPKGLKDIRIELPHVDTCIIVTNHSVYKVVLRKPILSVFMELVLKHNDLERAAKLAIVFGINAQQLLEQAGDILLTNQEFSRAVACYKLSKCRIVKSMLKFASVGYTADLLRCLTHCLASPAISELPAAARIHLSNLCVLSFIERTLRVSSQKSKAIYKEFLYFLSTNSFYDELLAVNIAGQTGLWEVLHHLATQKGLYGQMLDVLMKTIHIFSPSNFHPTPYGLLICLSEPSLIQAMLLNPELAKNHMSYILDNLQDSQIFVLQRLVTLYDPTNPVIRPRIVRCRLRHRTTSHSSQSSQCDSIDLVENDEADTLIEEIIEAFLLILLTLMYKKSVLHQEPSITCNIELLVHKKEHNSINSGTDFKRRLLCAGFSHVTLIRNGNVYTWGSSVQGCLGTGPSVLRYGSPQAISFFRTMEVEVLSVSCGHCHTLAVTNNGVYAWGSSQFGQLGLGKILQCSTPELVTYLSQEAIIDAVAGQYHSVALTADGRVFTWGWGVHGQLGHGNTEKKLTPTLVTSLLGTVIRCISAGHAHTLALSTEGIVYAFGCNIFGQLGLGNNVKSSVPMKVSLSDKICLIATGYFHNLAVSYTNKLYIWGASPQVLRLQAQTQKRNRILEQRDSIAKQFENIDEFEKGADNAITNDTNKENLESNAQNKNAQAKVAGGSADSQMRRQLDNTCLKNVNVGSLEEAQTHLKPGVVDTSLVKGDIIQISTGCHHNALVTRDGSLYTWGRNLDGQIGNGSRREVPVPTPLCYNPASIFAQVPPRHNAYKRVEDEQELDNEALNSMANERNGNAHDVQSETNDFREKINPIIKTVGVYCGYDYTIAIQPGGTVLAWGNNGRAQLGRLPVKDARDGDDKLVLIKKRVVRVPHSSHIALDVPSQVPNIPAPIISYQSYDVPSLAGVMRPLSVIEKSPGEQTLHHALEYFCGLYDSTRIIDKCVELRNYQACSKISMLQHSISEAFSYQLKILHELSLQSCSRVKSENVGECSEPRSSEESDLIKKSSSTHQVKKNTELFNKQVEKNLMDSVEDCAAKNKMKIPASKSLNSLQTLQQELYTFDCQGGLEELCKDIKCDNPPLGIFDDSLDSDVSSDSEEWMDNLILKDVQQRKPENAAGPSGGSSCASTPVIETADQMSKSTGTLSDKKITRSRQNIVTNEAIRVIKFFLNEMENETDTTKCKILEDAVDFWIEHDLPMQSIENVFLEHIQSIFYPLGLLLFCQEIMDKYLDTYKNDTESKSYTAINLFSAKFCLHVCSMLLHNIDEGQSTPEFIKLLSSLTADHYGPPLTGYPGSSGNNTSMQMMEGVMSTVSSSIHDSKSFVHIKDPDAVYRFLETEGDTMVFTCGHHFPLAKYKTEVISTMETELLTSESLVLPCTAQYLGKMLSQTTKPEILCPLCIPRAMETVKQNNG